MKRIFNTRRPAAFVLAAIVLLSVLLTGAAAAPDSNPVYGYNLEIFRAKQADEASLAYYRLPSHNIQSDDKTIIALAESITKGIAWDYEKAGAIHDWVAENIWYDWDDCYGRDDCKDWSALSVLQKKRCVCSGYSNLVVALLRASGIPAKYVTGFALVDIENESIFYDLNNKEINHAWCEAYAGGRWIIMDTTWDSLNDYEHGKYSQKKAGTRNYFDISLSDFSKDHKYAEGLFEKVAYGEFAYCEGLTSVVIPGNKIAINEYAFLDCVNLKTVIIPASVREIGYGAFANCAALTSLYIPGSVQSIGTHVFFGCANLTLYGEEGSYAEQYAKENRLNFIAETPPFVTEPIVSVTEQTSSVTEQAPFVVDPTPSAVFVDGERVVFEAYIIGGNNYFKLRDLALALNGSDKRFSVDYDYATMEIALTSGSPYVPVGGEMSSGDGKSKTAALTASKIYKDGRQINLTAYNIGGNNFFKLRDIMKLFDVGVTYDDATRNIGIHTNTGYTD